MQKILIQFDTDVQPSSFDRVVAVDSDVDQLFSYGATDCDNVVGLVHGAIFTRGPADLKNTAIFVGGSNVADGEKLADAISKAFFGPMQVSVMLDSNGCNTTAAAAVVAARSNLDLAKTKAVVLGGTGPVGQRVAELLAMEGADVTLVSRSMDRAAGVCQTIQQRVESAKLTPVAAAETDSFRSACQDQQLIVAAGAAGICFLPEGSLSQLSAEVAIDLNAVPPTGLAEVKATANGQRVGDTITFGALGVGSTKMKVHKRAIKQLFESNDQRLLTHEIYQIALEVSGRA